MSKVSIVVTHLAIVAIGWGLVAALAPRHSDGTLNMQGKSANSSTKSDRTRPDRSSGQRLLATLSRQVVIPEAPDAELQDRRSFEERVSEMIEQRSEPNVVGVPGVRQKSPSEIEEECRRTLILHDMVPVVDGANGPEFSYAFRHGRIRVRVLLDHLTEQLPEQAEDPLFPLVLYQLLAKENPGLAEPLLASLSEKEKLLEKRRHFPGAVASSDPDSTYAMLSTIPWEDGPMELSTRRWVWRGSAESNLYGRRADYLAWLEKLPRGPERDIAISGALMESSCTDSDSAEYLRPLIDDPGIRALR